MENAKYIGHLGIRKYQRVLPRDQQGLLREFGRLRRRGASE